MADTGAPVVGEQPTVHRSYERRSGLTTLTEPVPHRFKGGGAFFVETKRAVDAYLGSNNAYRHALRRLWIKTILGFALVAVGWTSLVFTRSNVTTALLSFSALLIGGMILSVCVLHDANHGAFFAQRRKSFLLGWTVDAVLGFSSYFWRQKHTAHHSYPNVAGWDRDIEQGPLLRLAKFQKFHPWYRWQHLYIWILYALALLRWHLTDLLNLRQSTAQYGRRPTTGELGGIALGKVLFVSWVFVIPSLFHPWQTVVLVYLAYTLTASLVMAVVFQLAHCVEDLTFIDPAECALSERYWAVHEVEATADFCQGNQALTWLLGSLNFQIEHHLFPRLPHTLYPEIASIVREKAAKHGVRYTSHRTLRAALSSHYRIVRETGKRGERIEIEMT